MAVTTTPAVLLRSHPYSETSRIYRFFSRDMGAVGVMARGARTSGSKGGSGLGTFASGQLTMYVKETRGLQTLKDFDVTRPRRGLGTPLLRFAAASVVAELVLRHGGESSNPALFTALEDALDAIELSPPDDLVGTLLAQGWRLVAELGYEPVLAACGNCGRALGDEELGRFDFDAGGIRCTGCSGGKGVNGPRIGPGARSQLGGLLRGEAWAVEDAQQHGRRHLRLLSDFVTYHVSGTRTLSSFAFLDGLLGRTGGKVG